MILSRSAFGNAALNAPRLLQNILKPVFNARLTGGPLSQALIHWLFKCELDYRPASIPPGKHSLTGIYCPCSLDW